MSSIIAIDTSLPEYHYTNEDLEKAGAIWLESDDDARNSFLRFLRSSQTIGRNYCMPIEEVLSLSGLKQRSAIFEEVAPNLGVKAIERTISSTDLKPSDVGALIFTSCSLPAIPSIDSLLLERVGFSRDITRVPVFQHGCAGGVVGLSLAAKLSKVSKAVCLTSLELCSLVFQGDDHTKGNLVGSAIFGDGCASALITEDSYGLEFIDTLSYLLPDTRNMMGYKIQDDGFHLLLDKDLPRRLISVLPDIVKTFLEKNGLKREDIPWWLFHPGGIRILDFLDTAFELEPHQSHWARDVLRETGNLSSASVLFVISRFLNEKLVKHGDNVLMLGIGPGLTIELILFRYSKPKE